MSVYDVIKTRHPPCLAFEPKWQTATLRRWTSVSGMWDVFNPNNIIHYSLVNTVVPALGDPRRERPPAVYGHYVMSRHISTLNYLWSAATCLTRTRTVIYWLSAPAITDSANKCHVFCGHFNQKLLARTQTCDRQFSQISVLSSGDQRAISERCHVIESDGPRDCGKSTPSLVTFALRHHVGKSRIMFVQPAMLKNRTILSFDQRIEVLCRLGEAHHVERLLPSQCGKTQMTRRPSMLSKQTGKVIVAYVKYKYSRTVGLQYISCYVSLILGLLYIIMTVRVFIRNIAGGDSSMWYCNAYYIWRPPPAHPSLWRAATCNVRTLLPGPEGVRSWQVLLYNSRQYMSCPVRWHSAYPWRYWRHRVADDTLCFCPVAIKNANLRRWGASAIIPNTTYECWAYSMLYWICIFWS